MLEFLRPIIKFDTWIYAGLGLVALFFIRLIWIARRDRIRSIFTLERENANARMTRYFIGLMIVFGLMMGVYYVSSITPTIVPPPQETPTPTPIIALPSTPTPPPTLEVVVDTPTPPPTLSSGAPPGCPVPGSQIFQPGNGAEVQGVIQVSGAANIDNFDYYKFEFRVPPSGEWSFIARYDNPVPEGVLGTWNTDTVSPGEYDFRLVVVDTIGNFPEPCVIRLIVQ
jgi:hypothetical protein